MNARAGLFVPLLSDEGAMGVIVAMNQLGADAFSEDDLRLAETFAARVAVAVRPAARGGQESTHEDHSEAKRAG